MVKISNLVNLNGDFPMQLIREVPPVLGITPKETTTFLFHQLNLKPIVVGVCVYGRGLG